MSLNNFIPQIWSAEILKTFEKSHVLAALCNRDYEGDIAEQGDSVKISNIGAITIGDYVKNSTSVTVQTLEAAQTILLIDQAKYFAFQIDDIDKAQMNVSVMEKAMSNAGWGLSDVVDKAIGGLYGSAAHTVTDAGFDSDLALNTIARAGQYLDEESVPSAGRWMVLPPWAIVKIILAKILNARGVSNDSVINDAFVGSVLGFDIYKSNNLTQSGTDPDYTTQGMAGVKDAISIAEQIVSVEAYRPESKFSDAMKGLHVYGYKVIQPKGFVNLALTYEAETT